MYILQLIIDWVLLFQMSLIVYEIKPLIFRIHGSSYIDDCEALDLKKT